MARATRRAAGDENYARGIEDAPEVIRPTTISNSISASTPCSASNCWWRWNEEIGGDVEESTLAEIYTVRELVDAVLESAAAGKPISGDRRSRRDGNRFCTEEPTDPEVLALARPGVSRSGSLSVDPAACRCLLSTGFI